MSTLLTDLLERSFIPETMPNIGPDYRGSFYSAIGWLEQTVGHEPTLTDATPANVTAMQYAMADGGMGWSRIRQLKIRIGSLCRHGFRLGVIDSYESVPTIKVEAPEAPARLRKVPGEETLAGWYLRHYRPALAKRVQRSRLNVYDKSIDRLDNIFGRHVALEEITETTLTQLRQGFFVGNVGAHTVV